MIAQASIFVHWLSVCIDRYHKINAQFFHRHCCFPSKNSKLVFRLYFYLLSAYFESKSFSTTQKMLFFQGCSNYENTLAISIKIRIRDKLQLKYEHDLMILITNENNTFINILIKNIFDWEIPLRTSLQAKDTSYIL